MSTKKSQSSTKNIIIVILVLIILGTWGYVFYSSKQQQQVIVQKEVQIVKVSDEKGQVQQQFNEALVRIDSLTAVNTKLHNDLYVRNSYIAKKELQIRHILVNKNATAHDLAVAKKLIADLNQAIANYKGQVQTLTTNNNQLTQDKNQLVKDTASLNKTIQTVTATNEYLGKKVDIASTFYASNIKIIPIHTKKNGKEKLTTKAKKVSKLLISFDVSNLIDTTQTSDIYISITGPDGKVSTTKGSTFQTREQGEQPYTLKVSFNYQAGKKNFIEVAWTQDSPFQIGSYTIAVYHNGFKIGEGKQELKKGTIFE